MRFLVTLVALFFITTTAHAEFLLQDSLRTTGGCTVGEGLTVINDMVIGGTTTLVGNTTLNGTMTVSGGISYDTTIVTLDSLVIDGTLDVAGNTTIGSTSNHTTISEDGVVTFTGDSRPVKYKWLPHTAIKAYTSIPPAFDAAIGAGGAWVYTDNTETALVFVFDMPEDVDDTMPIYVDMVWSSATQSKVGNFYLKYSVMGNDESCATIQQIRQGYKKSSAVANGMVQSCITIDTVSYDANDVAIACSLYRDASVAADTLNATAELYGVRLKYTSNKLGEEI